MHFSKALKSFQPIIYLDNEKIYCITYGNWPCVMF
jgi:hypothetical protein